MQNRTFSEELNRPAVEERCNYGNLHITKQVPRLVYVTLQSVGEGQAGYTHVMEIVKGLRNRGVEVDLIAPRYSGLNAPGILTRLREMLRIQLIATGRIFHSRSRGKDTCLYFRWHFGGVIIVPVALACRVPIVVEVNGPADDIYHAWPKIGAVGKWLEAIEYWILRRASRIIAVTPGLREWVQAVTSHCQIDVVPNGADTALFFPGSKVTLPVRPYFVFFGALTRWQGVSTMLAAVHDKQWPEGADLVIAGDGSERDIVKACDDPGGRVKYLGKIPYTDIPDLVRGSFGGLSVQSDLGGRAKTGLSPLKVYETMACGVPVIASDQPCLAELIRKHKCGIVVPPDDPAALASAVRYLFSHREEAQSMGHRGSAAVQSSYSWDIRAGDTYEIILSACKKKREE
jgi:glycosyltransferase involved in cell wall biosynthesis